MPAAKKKTTAKQSATENQSKAVSPANDTPRVQENQPERQSQFATILIGLLIIASGLLIYNYFQSVNQPNTTTSEQATDTNKDSQNSTDSSADKDKDQEQPKAAAQTHTVQSGESLWSVAESVYGDGHQWQKIAQANNLATDSLGRPVIEVGQKLTIPAAAKDEGALAQKPEPSPTPAVAGANDNQDDQLTQTPDTAIQTYTVQHGDTLWSIAQSLYGNGDQWTLIFNDSHNNLGTLADGAPLIHAGNELYVPQAP